MSFVRGLQIIIDLSVSVQSARYTNIQYFKSVTFVRAELLPRHCVPLELKYVYYVGKFD